jgi:Ni2+-binding GTPase involved in maturation of urease and hydrogenase
MHGHRLIEHFRPAIAALVDGRDGLAMLEVGSERGSGSTRLLAELAKSLKLKFITVDADAEVAQEAKNIVASIDPGFIRTLAVMSSCPMRTRGKCIMTPAGPCSKRSFLADSSVLTTYGRT